MSKKLTINREQYKRVKHMDHKQMETFLINMYQEAYDKGKRAAEPKVTISDIAAAIVEIKGIGTKKVTEIMNVINKLYEGKKNEQTAKKESI